MLRSFKYLKTSTLMIIITTKITWCAFINTWRPHNDAFAWPLYSNHNRKTSGNIHCRDFNYNYPRPTTRKQRSKSSSHRVILENALNSPKTSNDIVVIEIWTKNPFFWRTWRCGVPFDVARLVRRKISQEITFSRFRKCAVSHSACQTM